MSGSTESEIKLKELATMNVQLNEKINELVNNEKKRSEEVKNLEN